MHCRKPQVHIYTAVVALASGYRKGWTHHKICILAFKEEDHTIRTCPMSLYLVLWLQMNYWGILSNTNEAGRSTRRDKTWQSQNEKQMQQPTKSKCKWALNLWWREDLNVAQAVGRERNPQEIRMGGVDIFIVLLRFSICPFLSNKIYF